VASEGKEVGGLLSPFIAYVPTCRVTKVVDYWLLSVRVQASSRLLAAEEEQIVNCEQFQTVTTYNSFVC